MIWGNLREVPNLRQHDANYSNKTCNSHGTITPNIGWWSTLNSHSTPLCVLSLLPDYPWAHFPDIHFFHFLLNCNPSSTEGKLLFDVRIWGILHYPPHIFINIWFSFYGFFNARLLEVMTTFVVTQCIMGTIKSTTHEINTVARYSECNYFSSFYPRHGC